MICPRRSGACPAERTCHCPTISLHVSSSSPNGTIDLGESPRQHPIRDARPPFLSPDSSVDALPTLQIRGPVRRTSRFGPSRPHGCVEPRSLIARRTRTRIFAERSPSSPNPPLLHRSLNNGPDEPARPASLAVWRCTSRPRPRSPGRASSARSVAGWHPALSARACCT